MTRATPPWEGAPTRPIPPHMAKLIRDFIHRSTPRFSPLGGLLSDFMGHRMGRRARGCDKQPNPRPHQRKAPPVATIIRQNTCRFQAVSRMSARAVKWCRDMVTKTMMPRGPRAVLECLCRYHNEKTGDCFPSYQTLADSTFYTRRNVLMGIDALQTNGLIKVKKRRVKGHQGSNQFILFGPPKGRIWVNPRVNKTPAPQSEQISPCESEQNSQKTDAARVNPAALWQSEQISPESLREEKEDTQAKIRVITGGRV